MLSTYKSVIPKVHRKAFLAPGTHIIGEVSIGEGSSVWFNAVIRGDMNSVTIGKNSNVQDNAVVHVDGDTPVLIGDHVTIGHGAVVHGVTIGDTVLIGMNATLLDGAIVGANCIIGANALVTPGQKIPEGSLAVGVPAKVVRQLSDEEIVGLKEHAGRYRELWEKSYSQTD